MRALLGGTLFVTVVFAACGGDKQSPDRDERKPASKGATTEEPAAEPVAPPPAAATGPRYLRPNAHGTMVDAFSFPSVPASIVEKQVATTSSRREAAGVLRRFGLAALEGKTGEVWIARASLVDRSARERVLFVTFRGDASDGVRGEDAWIVFLGSTEDDRVLKIGHARLTAKTIEDAPIELEAIELHSESADDLVATWSSCAKPWQKGCHAMRAWTMQRGHPELILDVTSDTQPIVSSGSAPHDVLVDGKVLKFDAAAFSYR